MSDYIDRQAAIEAICVCSVDDKPCDVPCKEIQALIDIPAAEVIGVVRCKDCKHLFEDNGCPLRTWWTHLENDFCSYGERREDV